MTDRRRFSPLRLLALAVLVSGLGALGWSQATRAYERVTAEPSATWFSPYVDVTLTPTFHFEDPLVSPSADHVLGFVVADRREPCTPTWGTYYDLDGAGRQLDLDRRVERLRERDGDVIVSFGGAVNDELAVACTDTAALTDAYRAVIERYTLATIDLDIEGAALGDEAANARRTTALLALQKDAAERERPLAIWVTVPVAPTGLTPEGLAVVRGMIAAGVDLAGVNLMTMNYGGSRDPGESMAAANERALTSTHAQLAAAYRAADTTITDADVWSRIGATPMIGRNDVEGDVFTVADARALVSFSNRVKLGRMSMWSANRDDRCGVQAGDDGPVSNTCSGVEQEPLAFAWELSRLNAQAPVRTPVTVTEQTRAISRDDPSSSPYPIWRSTRSYERPEKVVWHGSVYEAKWFASGELPDAPVEELWDTPWRYIGPVLAGDASPTPARSALGGEKWTTDQVFLRGDRVRHGGFVYRAKWWTQGDAPQVDPDRPLNVPWTLVGRAPKAPTMPPVGP